MQLNNKLTADDGSSFQYAVTEDGRPGWKDGADTVHPFFSFPEIVAHGKTKSFFAEASSAYVVWVRNYYYYVTDPAYTHVSCSCNATDAKIKQLATFDATHGGWSDQRQTASVYFIETASAATVAFSAKTYGGEFILSVIKI